MNLIDDIVNEPIIGAHRDKEGAATAIADYFIEQLSELRSVSIEERLENRYNKLTGIGAFSEDPKPQEEE
jgi:acetyl-CoA carboxylase carboxyl transferase subunit alpha